jgi:hypothetical protein
VSGIRYEIRAYVDIGGEVSCDLLITNLQDDTRFYLDPSSQAYDRGGNAWPTKMAATAGKQDYVTLVGGVATSARIVLAREARGSQFG